MKRKYSIGLICAVVLLLLLAVTFGYHKQYEYVEEQARIAEENETLNVQGNAVKENIFYLEPLNGYVVVYLEDKNTIFEYTDIRVSELPDEIQREIEQGKRIIGLEKLYGFLENYSS